MQADGGFRTKANSGKNDFLHPIRPCTATTGGPASPVNQRKGRATFVSRAQTLFKTACATPETPAENSGDFLFSQGCRMISAVFPLRTGRKNSQNKPFRPPFLPNLPQALQRQECLCLANADRRKPVMALALRHRPPGMMGRRSSCRQPLLFRAP